MNINDLKELIRAVDESDLSEFKLEKCDIKIYMKKEEGEKIIRESASERAGIQEAPVEKIVPAPKDLEEKKEENLHIIKSPMIGVFYSSPSPDAESFVRPGSRVKKGDVLCILEAMKLMNEITSDVDGEIVEVLVENQSPVEYGQGLFKVRRV